MPLSFSGTEVFLVGRVTDEVDFRLICQTTEIRASEGERTRLGYFRKCGCGEDLAEAGASENRSSAAPNLDFLTF